MRYVQVSSLLRYFVCNKQWVMIYRKHILYANCSRSMRTVEGPENEQFSSISLYSENRYLPDPPAIHIYSQYGSTEHMDRISCGVSTEYRVCIAGSSS